MPISSRKKILNTLKNEYRGSNNYTSPVFNYLKHQGENLEKAVEEKIEGLNGKFIHCNSHIDFQYKFNSFISQKNAEEIVCLEENIRTLLPLNLVIADHFSEKCDISVTGCEFLVAQTGSVIVSTAQTGSRKIIAYPTIHVVIAMKGQLIEELSTGITLLSEKYNNSFPSQITVITGPSRTADIEKTLVMGAHGPKELIIFYIDE
jgi:L-lactate dehydrogenase complex protein LldG